MAASFAGSDGWIVMGPKLSHRAEPPATVPKPGSSTTASSTAERIKRGTHSRSHARYRIRDARISAPAPTAAYTAWRRKNRKLEPYSS
jgi:hypothetical protein